MKLIIDIPEEIVTAIQNGQDYRYDIHTAIAQGKPYVASGDLISRETLLNEFNTKCQSNCPTCEYRKWNSKLYRYECELINTAPKVSFVISPDYVTELQNINKELIKQLEEAERPQGEWIKIGELGLAYKCNKCEKVSVIPENFCPNCGADMRKGGTEE